MKLGVMAALFSNRTLEDTVAYCAECGLQAIELPVGAYPGKPFFDPAKVLANPKEQARIKALIKDHGLILSGLAVHGNPVHPDKKHATADHAAFETAVQLAPKLGTDIVITFSGCPGGAKGDKTPNWVTCPWPNDYTNVLKYQWDEVLVPYWAEQAKLCAKHGVRVAWEAHPGFCVYNPDTLMRLSERATKGGRRQEGRPRRESRPEPLLLAGDRAAPSRSSRTPTRARPRSPRSSCSTAAPFSSPAPSPPAKPARHHLRLDGAREAARHLRSAPPCCSSTTGLRVNLLDTPGHKDFSEDTYRVLTAVDAAVMVIDAAKGIEPQTRKLFEVCRRRGVPIFTFMNKCDRPPRRRLSCSTNSNRARHRRLPMNWPLGLNGPASAASTTGIAKCRCISSKRARGPTAPRCRSAASTTRFVRAKLEPERATAEANRGDRDARRSPATPSTQKAAVLAGELTPVFFGSAMNNFGVQLLLDGFLKHSPPPRAAHVAGMGRDDRAERSRVLRLRLQDPGQHGPEAPRPHRLHPRRAPVSSSAT
jgi:hypothetical protein